MLRSTQKEKEATTVATEGWVHRSRLTPALPDLNSSAQVLRRLWPIWRHYAKEKKKKKKIKA